MFANDTIVALATPLVPHQGSVAIVRSSGPESLAMIQSLFKAPHPVNWESHRIYYGHIYNQERVIDEVLVLWMQSPRSFTREDVIEIHCHGGAVVVQQVLALCLKFGARLAQPGEFTLRAYLNGRLDLTQAESVAQLVSSRSPQAAELAVAGVMGKLARPIRELRLRCLDLLTEIEARIDFEEDLPPLDLAEVQRALTQIQHKVQQLLATADQGERLRTGIRVALVGRPNVGKSSLLNTWSQTDRAIVTDLPGTTRDVLDLELLVRGMPVTVLDTAGIRGTTEVVEKIGIERSRQALARADVVLLVIEAPLGWTLEDQAIWEEVQQPGIIVLNKIDLVDPLSAISVPAIPVQAPVVPFSALQCRGIEALETALWAVVSAGSGPSNVEFAVNQRQKAALIRVKNSLERLQETQANQLPLDFWSIDLRAVVQALGEITGEDVTESLLDEIFSRFCLGK